MIEFLQQVFNGLAIGAVYTLIAIGLTIVFGILGIAHFAHGVVAMSGGYVTFFLIEKLGVPFFVAMMLAMLVGAILGLLVERFAYRPVQNAAHINAFIIALGLTMMIDGLNLLAFGPDQMVIRTPFQNVFNLAGLVVTELRVYVMVTTAVLIVAMSFFVSRTKTGRAIRAVDFDGRQRQCCRTCGVWLVVGARRGRWRLGGRHACTRPWPGRKLGDQGFCGVDFGWPGFGPGRDCRRLNSGCERGPSGWLFILSIQRCNRIFSHDCGVVV